MKRREKVKCHFILLAEYVSVGQLQEHAVLNIVPKFELMTDVY